MTAQSGTTYAHGGSSAEKSTQGRHTRAECEVLPPGRDAGTGGGTTRTGKVAARRCLHRPLQGRCIFTPICAASGMEAFRLAPVTNQTKKITDWERKPCPIQPGPVFHLPLFNSEKKTPLSSILSAPRAQLQESRDSNKLYTHTNDSMLSFPL